MRLCKPWTLAAALAVAVAGAAIAAELSPIELLGKELFFDANLSTPPGQSCATCHAPEAGFAGPDSDINAGGSVYPGAVLTRFGNRRPPTAAYAGESPILYFDEDEELFIGGMFWDGRATGEGLGDPLADQALGPFLNPVEQNNPGAKQVCDKVAKSDYAGLYEQVWGPGSLDCINDLEGSYNRIGLSIAAYEASAEVNPFDSKYDYYLMTCANAGNDLADCASAMDAMGSKAVLDPEDVFTQMEWDGFIAFVAGNDNDGVFEAGEGGNCAACHVTDLVSGGPPVFTDFTYDNLGVPINPDNPWYSAPPSTNPLGADWIDLGLGAFLEKTMDWAHMAEENYGKVKVPTLRNLTKAPYDGFVKAYMHNGVFTDLKTVTQFYSTRDMLPTCDASGNPGVDCWPAPEYGETVNADELGSLALPDEVVDQIVAFMETLDDGFQP
jgi:cytochrome c peroxidase